MRNINHPSKDLDIRQDGFGISGGLEKLYQNILSTSTYKAYEGELYGLMPHSGYYGIGLGNRPFKKGQASYIDEVSWYINQYEDEK